MSYKKYVYFIALLALLGGKIGAGMSKEDQKLCQGKKLAFATEENLVNFYANDLRRQCVDKVKDDKAYKTCWNKALDKLSRAREGGPNCYK